MIQNIWALKQQKKPRFGALIKILLALRRTIECLFDIMFERVFCPFQYGIY